jgi:hypothetical protein
MAIQYKVGELPQEIRDTSVELLEWLFRDKGISPDLVVTVLVDALSSVSNFVSGDWKSPTDVPKSQYFEHAARIMRIADEGAKRQSQH